MSALDALERKYNLLSKKWTCLSLTPRCARSMLLSSPPLRRCGAHYFVRAAVAVATSHASTHSLAPPPSVVAAARENYSCGVRFDRWNSGAAPRGFTAGGAGVASDENTDGSYSAAEAPPPTIFALSSAPGRAGVAVIRVSGTRAGLVAKLLPPGARHLMPKHRQARPTTFVCPDTVGQCKLDISLTPR